MTWIALHTRRLAVLALLLCGGACLAQSSTTLPERYTLLTQRNIFDSKRRPPSTRASDSHPDVPAEPTAPAPQTVRLTGVVVRDAVALAMFSGPNSEFSGTRRVGDALAGYTIRVIDTHSVILADGDQELRIPVGGGLSGGSETGWTVLDVIDTRANAGDTPNSGTAATGAATSPAGSGTPTSVPDADGAASDADDPRAELLRRMRERRQREQDQ